VASLRAAGFSVRARLGLVLGSGLGGFLDGLEPRARVGFDQVEGLSPASVPAHAGQVALVEDHGHEVLVLQGRLHAYEGLGLSSVVLPVALMAELGCTGVVLTNAAGGLRPQMVAGELAVLDDLVDLHLGDVGRGILYAPEGIPLELAARASSAGRVFDEDLSRCLESAARRSGIGIRSATYASVWGPNYEESATIGWLRRVGADVVGMSTGPEAAYLRAVGVRVAGLSCITNVAVEHGAVELSHDEVVEVGSDRSGDFSILLRAALPELVESLEAGRS
jgi:purine-nucleoside phosphorylase